MTLLDYIYRSSITQVINISTHLFFIAGSYLVATNRNNMKKLTLLICLLVLFLDLPSFAQSPQTPPAPDYNPKASYEGPYKMNTWSVSIHGGPSMFFGLSGKMRPIAGKIQAFTRAESRFINNFLICLVHD